MTLMTKQFLQERTLRVTQPHITLGRTFTLLPKPIPPYKEKSK